VKPLYFLGKALRSIRNAPFLHGVAALTIAVALVLAGTTAATALQARALLSSWGLRAELTLYLQPDVSEQSAARLSREAAAAAGGQARYVSADEALARLADALGKEGAQLLELAENPLPSSIEVVPRASATADELQALARRLAGLEGVAEVDHGAAWVDRIAGLSRAASALGFTLLPLLLLGATVLAASVIRLAIHARRDEIEILRLVGATDAFVRIPFLVEGTIAGLLGGATAAGALFLLARWLGPILESSLPLPGELSPLALAQPLNLLGVAAAGALLGLLSSAFSVGRHLR